MPYPLQRRHFLAAGALPLLAACGSPLPLAQPARAGTPEGAELLRASAMAHGLAAYAQITDINIAYAGQWRPLIDRVQPEVVDAGYRGTSQERLMPSAGIVAQAYTGPRGRKQVAWRRRGGPAAAPGEVAVWNDGVPQKDPAWLSAAALVAESYGLFLLGPLWLHGRGLPVALEGTERVDGRLCDVLQIWSRPGLGLVAEDRVSLCVDRASGLARRMRFTLEGFAGTQGAVARVDTFDHESRFGVMWPMRSYEEVEHPLRLPAHDWSITGLNVNRGYLAQDLLGPQFGGAAAAPAQAL